MVVDTPAGGGRPKPADPAPVQEKKGVAVGPGINDVTVTPVSRISSWSASANDCTNDFDALYML